MNEQFFAENDIDKTIRNQFFPDYSYKGTFVEIGGADPQFISMSNHFKLNNWRTIIIEPNPRFFKKHIEYGNEAYQYACSDSNQNDVDFTIVHMSVGGSVTDESFSSLKIKDSYRNMNPSWVDSLNKTVIKINTKTLDTIIKECNISHIDILSVDTEGWELEVMKGLSIIHPKIVILENILSDVVVYREYMASRNYHFYSKIGNNDIYTKNL
jgi:FkbM family methyltransferase